MKPCFDELELVDDVRPEQAQGVRERREPEARTELLGDRRTADDVARRSRTSVRRPRLREVRRVRQPVVAATDDDRVVGPVVAFDARLRRLDLRLRARGACVPFVFAMVRPSFAVG